jgi:hypothetical protein
MLLCAVQIIMPNFNQNPNQNGYKPQSKVKLCGLYKQKRQRDGKTYLAGRVSYTAKFLCLPNDEKTADSPAYEPDYWLFLVEDEKKPRGEAAPIPASSTEVVDDPFS